MTQQKKTSAMLRREAGQARIAGLLDELRTLPQLREGRPGTFQLRSRAFLHFHYRPDGSIVADVRLSEGGDFTRLDVSTERGQKELVSAIHRFLAS